MVSRPRTMTWLLTALVHTLAPMSGISAEPWSRAYVDALPDEAFAVVHLRPDGTRSRHLPHHTADGLVDPAHLRSALVRLGQVRWEDPAAAEQARRHLLAHQEALGISPVPARAADGRSR